MGGRSVRIAPPAFASRSHWTYRHPTGLRGSDVIARGRSFWRVLRISLDWLLQHCSPTLVATHTFVNPLVAVLFGWLWASEPMSLRIVIATVVILGAIVLIQRGDRHAEMQAEAVQSD